jgi:hypothetical protein
VTLASSPGLPSYPMPPSAKRKITPSMKADGEISSDSVRGVRNGATTAN